MFAPWKKNYDKPRQHIKKQRHYFANNSLYSQSYAFSSSHVWMWELYPKEGWALKDWCFWTVGWRRFVRVPWKARRSNQSILREIQEISPEYSLEGLMLKLKLHTLATWWEELTHWKRPWFWERLKAGVLGSFNRLGPGGQESTIRKWKRERGWYSLVYAENQ